MCLMYTEAWFDSLIMPDFSYWWNSMWQIAITAHNHRIITKQETFWNLHSFLIFSSPEAGSGQRSVFVIRDVSTVMHRPSSVNLINEKTLKNIHSWTAVPNSKYCKFGNFRENFIFANSIKRHICDFNNSQLGHKLPSSVNKINDLTISWGFNFHETSHMRSLMKIKLTQISELTVI